MKRISIKDIALQAGVVPSTVSLVLNGKTKEGRISHQVAERIRRIAEETGYSPNQTAVSLRTGRSKILGLIVEDISNVFFASLAKIIEDRANTLGFKILYCSTDNDDQKGCELIRVLLNRQVDGFLITPSQGMMADVKKLMDQQKPVVLMDRYFPDLATPCVLVDNIGGVRDGVEHLLSGGYQHIAYVTNELDQMQMHQREQGYRETLIRHRGGVEEELILKLPYHVRTEEAVAQIMAFLQSNPVIDAVFFATNYIGVYGLEAISKLRLAIPGDVAVICFDDHDLFRLLAPGISCIEQPINEIAITAVEILMEQLENRGAMIDIRTQLKHPNLILRNSS